LRHRSQFHTTTSTATPIDVVTSFIKNTLVTANVTDCRGNRAQLSHLAAAGHCKRRLHAACTVHSALTNRWTDV